MKKEGLLQQHSIKVIISGGGTGGHIFPAIAIANAIKKLRPDAEFLFVGAKGKMEMEKVPAAGYKIEGLWISGLQRRLTIDNLMFPFKVISSVMRSHALIKKFKADVVVGVGGYASGPLLYAATGRGIPALVQEQNSYPGITNKILASRVSKICVAYDGMERFFPKEKLIMTGNPIRQDLMQISGLKQAASVFFNLEEGVKTVLVIGGSLGARTINESMALGIKQLLDQGVQVIWQTGKSFIGEARAINEKFSDRLRVFDFVSRMDYAYAMADVVVSRAGATSISELCVVQKPCILVPSPNVSEDHQTKNSMAMVNQLAAMHVKDIEAREKLIPTLIALLNDQDKMVDLKKNIARLGKPDAAEQIANEVLKLVKQ
jgi:UDP-N-acetylglucosamine--N-acetylmuramyl-(pentapeptide) pyrophosphoryl-undecaprenol N-acetylglucosamine transferase